MTMNNKQVTAEWIAQQREICDVRIAKMLGKFEQNAYDYNIDGRVLGVNISEFKGYILLAGLCSEVLPAALDALEASMRREAEKDAEIERMRTELDAARLKRPIELSGDAATSFGLAAECSQLQQKIARLTAERDGENKRADAVPEIDLRPLQPGYMGVCTTDDEDGIQIRKVSHKHPQGRGYLDDDEDVQDVVVVRFADTAQVLAVADRLLVLADAMAEKTGLCAANAPTGAESEQNNESES